MCRIFNTAVEMEVRNSTVEVVECQEAACISLDLISLINTIVDVATEILYFVCIKLFPTFKQIYTLHITSSLYKLSFA